MKTLKTAPIINYHSLRGPGDLDTQARALFNLPYLSLHTSCLSYVICLPPVKTDRA